MNELMVPGSEIKIGDIMRFRMSKHEPARWLRVLAIKETVTGRRLSIALESNCGDIVSKREKRHIRRFATQEPR